MSLKVKKVQGWWIDAMAYACRRGSQGLGNRSAGAAWAACFLNLAEAVKNCNLQTYLRMKIL